MSDEKTVTNIILAILQETPHALEWIERLVHNEKAKRVEEIRTAAHAQEAVDMLKGHK